MTQTETQAHTPGPWESEKGPAPGFGDAIFSAKDTWNTIADNVRHKPDVYLIEAAPDLLEAAEGFMRYLQQELIPSVRSVEGGQALLDTGWQLVADGHILVAKARGGKP
jgi:hypothetical protein